MNVQYKGQTGWVEKKKVSQDRFIEKSYFRVTTASGLNLREKPNSKSRIIGFAKFNHIGLILEKSNKEQIIQNETGYWFRTEVKQKKGWMFSGFVSTGRKKDLKNHITYWQWQSIHKPKTIALKNLIPSQDKTIKFLAPIQNIKVKTVKGNIIYEVDYKYQEVAEEGLLTELIIWNQKNKDIYYITRDNPDREHREDRLYDYDDKFGVLFLSRPVCKLCCGNTSEHVDIYFLKNDKVLFAGETPMYVNYAEENSCSGGYFWPKSSYHYDYQARELYIKEISYLCSDKNEPLEYDLERARKRLYVYKRKGNKKITLQTFEGKYIPQKYQYLFESE